MFPEPRIERNSKAAEMTEGMNHFTTRVAQRLRTRATLFKRQNHDYAQAYIRVGEILNGIFPEGIFIKGQQKFSEIGLLVRMLDEILQGALLRFQNSKRRVKGTTTQDTLENLGVLSFMWAELIDNNTKKSSKRKSLRKLKELYRHKTDR